MRELKMHSELQVAWNWREARGLYEDGSAIRVFHGPGEGSGDLRFFAIDRFDQHYWVTQWDNANLTSSQERVLRRVITGFLEKKGASSVVGLGRPQKGVAPLSETWCGDAPLAPIRVREGEASFWIRLRETRHPGLFLDHFPLRQWLMTHVQGLRVLNTFSYTGSLSVVAALGGAQTVTTLDLSKPTIQWAQENFELNSLQGSEYQFIAGDVFEWLPRFRKSKKEFDCIILDPPSFARGKKGSFSTSKDLAQLHGLALDLLAPGGFLVTSINSANVSLDKFEADLLVASRERKVQFQVHRSIDLPETFPTRFGQGIQRYLKGWILRRVA